MEVVYINHVEDAFKNAENNISNITEEIIKMQGMSGKKLDIFTIIY
jgi:hypothetical protein